MLLFLQQNILRTNVIGFGLSNDLCSVLSRDYDNSVINYFDCIENNEMYFFKSYFHLSWNNSNTHFVSLTYSIE